MLFHFRVASFGSYFYIICILKSEHCTKKKTISFLNSEIQHLEGDPCFRRIEESNYSSKTDIWKIESFSNSDTSNRINGSFLWMPLLQACFLLVVKEQIIVSVGILGIIGQTPSIYIYMSKSVRWHVDIFQVFLHWFEVYSIDSSRMIGNPLEISKFNQLNVKLNHFMCN